MSAPMGKMCYSNSPVVILLVLLMTCLTSIEAKQHTNLIIVGGTGDLARKYLWRSALKLFVKYADENNTFSLYAGSRIPEIEGTAALNQIMNAIQCEHDDRTCLLKRPEFMDKLKYVQLKSAENYTVFCQNIAMPVIESQESTLQRQIFYLSIPSSAYESVAKLIHDNCRDDSSSRSMQVVLEKPFGSSKGTASTQAEMMEKYFSDNEIFRVDHYLAKSVTKQILKFRHANKGILEKLLTRQFVDRIEVVMKETIGVKDRIDFYDQNGVVRDVMQNHLIELLALVIMEMPSDIDDSNAIEEMKLRCLRQFKSLSSRHLLTGQYSSYLQEALSEKGNISQSLNTPTFAAALLQNSNIRWKNVPMVLLSGKHMDERSSFVRILFREREFCVSGCVGGNSTFTKYPRQIIFQIGHGDVPSAGILVSKSLFKPVWPEEMKDLSITSKDKLIHGQSPGDFHYGVPLTDVQAYDAVLQDLFLNVKETFVTTARMLLLWDIWDNVLNEFTDVTPRKYLEGNSKNINFKVEDSALKFLSENDDSSNIAVEESTPQLYSIPNTFRNGSLFCMKYNDLIYTLAKHIYNLAEWTSKQGNNFHIAFSGGKSPVALFEELANKFPMFPWQDTHIWQVDERCVSHNHRDSNFLSIHENLLKNIDIPYFNIHPMPVNIAGQICDRDNKGDILYEDSIKHFIQQQKFDIIVLGLGTDGHTASLFPNSEHLLAKQKLVSFTKSTKGGNFDRMSLLLPLINKAKEIALLVTGKEKHEILKKVIDIEKPDKNYPVTFVSSDTSKISWYVDLRAWTGIV